MSNLATKILDEIQKEMKIDEQWMSSTSNSLTWVAHKLEQTFSVSAPFTHLGKEAVAVESRIPVVLHVKHPKEQVCGLLCQFNYTNIGSAYVFDADQQEVFSSLKVVVTEADLAQRCWQVRTFALFQMIMVEHQAQHILDALSGDLAKADSTRKKPDAMLDSFMGFVTSRPRSENRFENQEEFKLAADYCAPYWHYPLVTNQMSKPPWRQMTLTFGRSLITKTAISWVHGVSTRGIKIARQFLRPIYPMHCFQNHLLRKVPFNWGCGHVFVSGGVFQIRSSASC
jgi:hypothetical protein